MWRTSDSEFPHPKAQCVGMHVEQFRSAALAFDYPGCLFQNRFDVTTLSFAQGDWRFRHRRHILLCGWRSKNATSLQGQRRALGKNHRALNDILYLANVTRPCITGETRHRLLRDLVHAFAKLSSELLHEEHRQ